VEQAFSLFKGAQAGRLYHYFWDWGLFNSREGRGQIQHKTSDNRNKQLDAINPAFSGHSGSG